MPRRRWTIIIVSSDNSRTRTFTLGARARRLGAWLGGIAGALVVAAVVVLFTPWGTPGALILNAENERLRAELARIEERVAALDDTLFAIGQREQQMRLLAGLPLDSTVVAGDSLGSPGPIPATDGRAMAGAGVIGIPGRQPRRRLADRLGLGSGQGIDSLLQRAAVLAASFRAVSDTLTRNFERMANTPSIMPTSGWLSSHFTRSRFHPVLHENLAHEGIDVSAPMGAPIVAPASGRVISAGFEAGYGNTLEIDHGNGIVTRYAHCSRIVVRRGQQVTRGQLIATVGNSGLSTGPHLHYEVHVNGRPENPLRYVLPERIAD
jgi:murein DD-endopeptidase MepM/ murein hydrolase activator NlpD